MHVSDEDAQTSAKSKSIEMKDFAAKPPETKGACCANNNDDICQDEQELNVICIGNLNRNNRTTWYSHTYTLASVDKSTIEKPK